jgi:hypothetical protein
MRDRLVLLAAAALLVWPVLARSAPAPQAPAGGQNQTGEQNASEDEARRARQRGLQVGVPDGAGPGQGRQGVVGGLDAPPDEPVRAAPRGPGGRVLLGGASPDERGLWLPGRGGFANSVNDADAVPFQPWAQALYADRGENQLEPHTRCKPSGGIRQFLTPYGVEIVELPALQRVYIFDIGGPHTFRTIYMDGRTHSVDFEPTYYGHSIGWWEGDTLVIDTTGYNEGFWIDRRGLPTTERLHTLERLTRVDFGSMTYELTIDDPGAYTRPWTSGINLRWERDTELFEYMCQQANQAYTLMLGTYPSVDRTSPIVP